MLHCNCSILRSASRALSVAYDEALSPVGIRVTQFAILARMNAVGPTSVNDLADRLTMDRTTLGRNVRVLERDGLIGIGVGEDRRARVLELTPKGKKVLDKAMPLWSEVHERFEAMLGRKEADSLRGTLTNVIQAGRALYSGDLATASGD
jgi:DNA-binding MarR family transcriptional regulator